VIGSPEDTTHYAEFIPLFYFFSFVIQFLYVVRGARVEPYSLWRCHPQSPLPLFFVSDLVKFPRLGAYAKIEDTYVKDLMRSGDHLQNPHKPLFYDF